MQNGLSAAGDPLERFNAAIDWEIFHPILNRLNDGKRKSAARGKPICRTPCSSYWSSNTRRPGSGLHYCIIRLMLLLKPIPFLLT